MKNIFLLLILSACYLYANVGSIAAVSGDVLIIRDSSKIKAKLNDIVQKNDTIKSIGASKAQILFLDNTVVTIGKDTVLNIQEFIVDNASNSNVRLNVLDGLFRVMTGKISKVAPDKFKVQTNNVMLGIRGTIFVGDTNSLRDKIACIKGAVIVEAQGKSLDLLEGEIIYIQAGEVPRNPKKFEEKDMKNFSNISSEHKELTDKIVESMDFDNPTLVDATLENFFLDEIQDIDNINNQAATYNNYVDALHDEYYALLSKDFFENDVKGFKVNEYEDLFSDGYVPLYFTYFTYREPQSDAIEDIMAAIPIAPWRHDENIPLTPESKIVEYMGGINPWTQEVYSHWDGRASGRKLVSFSGNIIGQVSSSDSEELVVSLLDPQNNDTSIFIDFGNGLFTSTSTFQAPDLVTGETKNSSLKISFIDEATVSTTGFHTHGENYSMQDGRFYGENLNQIGAEFIVEDFENDTIINGAFVANNIAEYDSNKLFMGEDDDFAWGYWNSDLIGNFGVWIEPKIENTPVDVISDYITQQELYTYSGGVIGTFSQISEGIPTQEMNGEFFLNIDFGKETLDGRFFLESGEDTFDMSITQGVVDEKGFYGSEYILNSKYSTRGITELDMNGQFFGSDAQKIGGGMKFETDTQDVGVATFIGTKVQN